VLTYTLDPVDASSDSPTCTAMPTACGTPGRKSTRESDARFDAEAGPGGGARELGVPASPLTVAHRLSITRPRDPNPFCPTERRIGCVNCLRLPSRRVMPQGASERSAAPVVRVDVGDGPAVTAGPGR
jgi:hypothetical protein